MAVVYFTNNADAGEGSFRDALTKSSPGDTIAPDPSVNWNGETITILLSSPITWGNRSRTVTGGQSHRIRFDGQGTVNHINFSNNNTIKFERCDFVRGYRETFGCMFHATNASPTVEFIDCLCAGNKSDGDSAAYNLSSNSSSYKYDVTAINCVIAGDAQTFVTSTRATRVVYKNCTFVKNLSTPSSSEISTFSNCIRYINSDESDIGFVNVPATVYNADTWTPNLWQTWDARLKPGSQYLIGYNGDEKTDFLGNTRKVNGALGAYEGAWIVTKTGETTTIDETTRVDYLEAEDGATIAFGGSVQLIAESSAVVGSTTFSAAETARAYVAFPVASDVSRATFGERVNFARLGGVSGVSATVSERTATAAISGDAPPNWIEFKPVDSSEWTRVDLASDGTFTTPSDAAFVVRAYDGEFTESDEVPRAYYYRGAASGGSFADPTDWAMDHAKTLICRDVPTIKNGYFDCR